MVKECEGTKRLRHPPRSSSRQPSRGDDVWSAACALGSSDGIHLAFLSPGLLWLLHLPLGIAPLTGPIPGPPAMMDVQLSSAGEESKEHCEGQTGTGGPLEGDNVVGKLLL